MEDVVAVRVRLSDGNDIYFVTWGRIQDDVDSTKLEQLVLLKSQGFAMAGRAVSAEMCETLQAAREQPYFFEAIISFSQEAIPTGDAYVKWREDKAAEMQKGKGIYFLGR